MYDVYLDKILLPIAPSKIQLKIKNQNKTVTLINEGEINLLKKAGLTDIQFTAMIPQQKYPFAKYSNGFQGASFYLDGFEKLKISCDDKGKFKPFQLIISRALPNGTLLFDSNIKVSLEDYAITEDAMNGFDLMIDFKLKQFKPFGTKTMKIEEPPVYSAPTIQSEQPKATVQQERPAETAPQAKTHTVVNGDTLWAIAKIYYNDGNQYTKILAANKDKVSSANLIYSGQVLVLP